MINFWSLNLKEIEKSFPNLSNSEDAKMSCSICLKLLSEKPDLRRGGGGDVGSARDVIVVVANCHHLFHQECISAWIKKDDPERLMKECPLCKELVNIRDLRKVYCSASEEDDIAEKLEEALIINESLNTAHTEATNQLKVANEKVESLRKAQAETSKKLEEANGKVESLKKGEVESTKKLKQADEKIEKLGKDVTLLEAKLAAEEASKKKDQKVIDQVEAIKEKLGDKYSGRLWKMKYEENKVIKMTFLDSRSLFANGRIIRITFDSDEERETAKNHILKIYSKDLSKKGQKIYF